MINFYKVSLNITVQFKIHLFKYRIYGFPISLFGDLRKLVINLLLLTFNVYDIQYT